MTMKNPFKIFGAWIRSVARVWGEEMMAVFHDPGVMLFFFALPTLYPIVYTLIYNPEVADNIPVVMVDNSRSVRSRELYRMIDATQAINMIGYASNMQEARRALNSHECVAIVEVPADYSKRIGNGEQATVPFYCDMSLLLRYRSILSAMTDIQLTLGTEIRGELIDNMGTAGQVALGSSKQVETDAVMLGDTTQGFASFVMPGIFVLILQQSLVLGICMLSAGREERRKRLVPESAITPPGADAIAKVLGRMLCYLLLYIPLVLYILRIVPWMFSLPSVGNMWHYLLLMQPLLIASCMFGMTLSVFVTERESSMVIVVFSSVVFLFLSGLTWPRYAMSPFWHMLGNLVPGTWGVEGFIRMASDGGTLAQQTHAYKMLWLLSAVYFIPAVLITRYLEPRHKTPKS